MTTMGKKSPTQRSGMMALTRNDAKVLGKYTKRLEKSMSAHKFQTHMFKTHNSNWTPMVHKPSNEQIYKERREMVSNWFDVWSDSQRKRFLAVLFQQCKRSQLQFIQEWFNERVPLRHLDFTRVLPRFLSLYVLSFLDPRSMCRAAAVSWHWRVLAEQDVLWMPKCIRYGWYLPYTPDAKEYGAWKNHYVACLQTLDLDVPSKNASAMYGTLGDGSKHLQTLRRKSGRLDARASMEILERRPEWQPPDRKPQDLLRASQALLHDYNPNDPRTDPSQSLHHTKHGLPKAHLSTHTPVYYDYGLQSMERRTKHRALEVDGLQAASLGEAGGAFTTLSGALELVNLEERRLTELSAQPWEPQPDPPRKILHTKKLHMSTSSAARPESGSHPSQPHPRVIFISSRVPAAELLVDALLFGVIPIVYEYEGSTLESLMSRLDHALQGRAAQSIGIFTHSEVHWELRVVHGATVTLDNLDDSSFVEFFESLGNSVQPSSEGGHIDVFSPLASCEAGMEMILQMKVLTGVSFTAPTGVVGNYNHINSEWLPSPEAAAPPTLYFCTSKLCVWANTADQVLDACVATRKVVGRYFERKHHDLVAQLTGQIIFDATGQVEIQGVRPLAEALVEGLVSLAHEQNPPLNVGARDSSLLGVAIRNKQSYYAKSGLGDKDGVKPFEYLGKFLLNRSGTSDYMQTSHQLQSPGATLAPAPTLAANSLSDQLCLTERFEDSLPNSEFSHLTAEEDKAENMRDNKLKYERDKVNQEEKQDEEKEEEEVEEMLTPRQEDNVDTLDPLPGGDRELQDVHASLQNMYSEVLPTDSRQPPPDIPPAPHASYSRRLTAQQLADHPEKRTPIAHEILASEVEYMRTLEIIQEHFYMPLRSALASNRAIISAHNLQDIFSDPLMLLDISKGLVMELRSRLVSWGPHECLGDIFVKFCTKLKAYVNFLNNYPIILITIERCLEQTPNFRAFLKRHERQPETKMLSLPELLLAATRRIADYVTLLTWFSAHTPVDHADRKDLASALKSIQELHKLIQDTKQRGQRERELSDLQKSILHCPVLLEANRFFLQQQDVAHLRKPKSNTIIPELRVYQHIEMLGLYLFNDSLVVTRRTSRHTAFERAVEQHYRFETCAALTRLRVEDIPNSKYVKNSFRLHTPHRDWICATETFEEKLNFVTVLENTIRACIQGE